MKEISSCYLNSISGGNEAQFSFIGCIPIVTTMSSAALAVIYFKTPPELIAINYATGIATYAVYPIYPLAAIGSFIGFAFGIGIILAYGKAHDFYINYS